VKGLLPPDRCYIDISSAVPPTVLHIIHVGVRQHAAWRACLGPGDCMGLCALSPVLWVSGLEVQLFLKHVLAALPTMMMKMA